MEFFTREICVCAHLTQTRDALEKCAGMEISMKKRILTGILTGLICLTMAACGDADVDATGSVESTGKIEVSEESEKESIEASATGSEKGSTEVSASGSEKESTEVSASGSEKGSAAGSEKGSTEASATGSEKGSTEASATGSTTGNSGQNVDGKTDGSVENVSGEAHPITEEEYNSFSKTCEATDASGFDDFEETLNQDYTGTWYDPVMGEAIRLCEEGAYVYIPYLNEYGDTLYEWEVIDRAKRGLCPELAIYISGRGAGPLAYYVAGYREGYFYGNSQGFIFYKQD